MFHELGSNARCNANLISRKHLSLPFSGSGVAQRKDILYRLLVLQRATEWIHKDLWPRKSWDCQLQRSGLLGPPRLASSWLKFSLDRHEARSFEARGSHNIQVPRFQGQFWLLGTPVPLHPGISGNPRPEAQSQLRLAVSEPGLHFLSQIITNNNSWSNWNYIGIFLKLPEQQNKNWKVIYNKWSKEKKIVIINKKSTKKKETSQPGDDKVENYR